MNETQGPSVAIESIDQVARIARLADERAADIVEFLNEETPELAAHVLVGLPRDRAIEVIDQPDFEHGPEIIALLPREIAADLLAGITRHTESEAVFASGAAGSPYVGLRDAWKRIIARAPSSRA